MKVVAGGMMDRLMQQACLLHKKTVFTFLKEGESPQTAITYGELETKVLSLATHLHDRHLAGERVLLFYQDSPGFVVAFFACQFLGITAVPVPFGKGGRAIARLAAITKDALPAAVFSDTAEVQQLREAPVNYPGEIINTQHFPHTGEATERTSFFNPVSFIQYTSGSTGSPKGVVVSHQNLMHNQQLIKNTFGCDELSVIFSWLPFHHDMGLIGNILHTIYAGCTCVIMSPAHFMQRPQRWLQGISTFRATHSGGPNFAFDICIDKIPLGDVEKLDLSCWKVAYNGSEQVRPETVRRFAGHFAAAGFSERAFYPCYGLAESTLLVAGCKQKESPATIEITYNNDGPKTMISSGAVVPGMEVLILNNESCRPCTELESGEILICGESVTAGYWNKDNSNNFFEWEGRKFLRTGDTGFLHKGELYNHGRISEMLIVRGRNIFPYDIEHAVAAQFAEVELNGVALYSLDKDDERIVLAAELRRSHAINANLQQLVHGIDQAVTGISGLVLHDIILTKPLHIPRTTSGKLQRGKCRELYLNNEWVVLESKKRIGAHLTGKTKNELLVTEVKANGDYGTIKKYLIDLIHTKLPVPYQQLPDDKSELTDMGIDSLRAVDIVNTINRDFNLNMDISRVLHGITLGGFILTIENMLWVKTSKPLGKEITI